MEYLKDCYGDFLEYKRKNGITEKVIESYRYWMVNVLDKCVISEKRFIDLRLVDCADVKNVARGFGDFGAQRSVSLFRQLLRYLDESGVKIPFNWVLIRLPKVAERDQDFMELPEFDDFVGRLNVSVFYQLRDRALYEVLWSSGLRIGEALRLNRDDYKSGEVVIKNEKGGDEAKVFFSDRCIYWLDRYMARRSDDCEALFVTYSFDGVNRCLRSRCRQRLFDYKNKFNLSLNLTHMLFRRSYGSEIIDKGTNIKAAQDLMRHKSERTILKFYAKVKKRHLREIHNNIFNKMSLGTPNPADLFPIKAGSANL